jgi:hypothetical protein
MPAAKSFNIARNVTGFHIEQSRWPQFKVNTGLTV